MARTILIADKSDTIRRKAREILTAKGWGVVTVSNGVAALMKLPTLDLAFILADISMPGKDGYEVCDFIKNSPNLSHLPVFLTFNENEPYDEQRGTQVRADGRVKKKTDRGEPLDSDELTSLVSRFVIQAGGFAPKHQRDPQPKPAEGRVLGPPAVLNRSARPVVAPDIEQAMKNARLPEASPISTHRPLFTRIIVVVNILIFAVMVISGVSILNPTTQQLLAWGANFGLLTVTEEWWRLFSSTFIHIGLMHLLFNMWCLWNLGSLAEEKFGNWTFLILYVLSGLGGSIASVAWNPAIVSAGASGAIFGVAGGTIALFGGKLDISNPYVKERLNSILAFVGYNLFFGFTQSGIDNAAHMGGLVTGFLVGVLIPHSSPDSKPASPTQKGLAVAGVTFFLILGAGFAKSRVTSHPVGRVVAADKLLETNQLDKAITEYRKSLELDPDLVEARHNLGVAYLRKELYDEAISAFEKVLEIKPDDVLAQMNLGLAYTANGLYDKSIPLVQKVTENNPQDSDAHYYLAGAYRENGDYDEAIASYEKALELMPNDLAILNDLGLTLISNCQLDDALVYLDKAIALQPEFPFAHFNRGLPLREINMEQEAMQEFTEALRLDPTLEVPEAPLYGRCLSAGSETY